MNDNNVKKMPEIKFGCMSWTGAFLSIAIIAIRAFQSGAQPMESWSALSWCLMLLPTALPFLLWIALGFLWFVIYILVETFKK